MYQQNRQKLCAKLKEKIPVENTVVLLKGVPNLPIHDQDCEYLPQQESNFYYLFGYEDSDCYAILEVDTGSSILFTPFYAESYKMWMRVYTLDEIKNSCGVDQVLYVNQLEQYLSQKNNIKILYYNGVDSDSGLKPDLPKFDYLQNYNSDDELLYSILNECRVTKSKEEINVMRYICKLSSQAHERVLREIRAGQKEYHIEALFAYHTFSNSGSRFQAYNCICASGRDAATLHYIVNDKLLKEDSLILSDMGAKYKGYCSDITVTFPASGKFNEKQKIIYNAVLDAQNKVNQSMRPGVNWGHMHLLAERTIVTHLHEAGLLVGDLENIISKRIGALFFPHGLGHLLGLRVHDVGGYNIGCPERSTEPGLNKLRTRRNLEVGMVITNEPGCYFIEYILQQAFENEEQSKYLNKEKILEFMDVGGVRLEDDVLVTSDGVEILSDVPRSIQQVESCMRGENWRELTQK